MLDYLAQQARLQEQNDQAFLWELGFILLVLVITVTIVVVQKTTRR